MGALHEGHLALVREAKARADRVLVSIFVNPTQFGPGEDYEAYPRTLDSDLEKLAADGVEAVYLPRKEHLYPDGDQTRVVPGPMQEVLCGAHRPGHFDGVATVVLKLFQQVRPDVAVFGEKDFQQLQIIRRMTADFFLPVDIIGAPTVRETDGLALSSRNAYLSRNERKTATALNTIMRELIADVCGGADPRQTEKGGMAALKKAGFDSIDYLEFRRTDDLGLAGTKDIGTCPVRLFAAARLGTTRLIDNIPLETP